MKLIYVEAALNFDTFIQIILLQKIIENENIATNQRNSVISNQNCGPILSFSDEQKEVINLFEKHLRYGQEKYLRIMELSLRKAFLSRQDKPFGGLFVYFLEISISCHL